MKPGSLNEEALSVLSDLRLYLHQRYGVPLGVAPSPPLAFPLVFPPLPREGERVGVRGSTTPPASEIPASARTLEEVRRILGDCRRCGLCAGRTNIVFGDGPDAAGLMIVGEAPGAEEDAQGKPFVGRSGQLLSRMLKALGLEREQVYITNVVKCRPPENRNPKVDEVSACSPFLTEQARLVRPKVLLALGTFAAQTLLQTNEPIMKLRGKPYTYAGLPLIVTLHPAACLYNPGNKKYVWEDIKGIPEMLKMDPA
ncbi:MAG: hypothetical protein A3G34_02450 [Candidatus Lindowbacteria bacterium RIFCSPLOWO2_12_FULL_62_27]|nr:MAG: hypothetical protein A3G34_02450 [Candidatus Lindowbacteria bacterium RIFCSPLOWO2_12_FULL_62_27]